MEAGHCSTLIIAHTGKDLEHFDPFIDVEFELHEDRGQSFELLLSQAFELVHHSRAVVVKVEPLAPGKR